MLIKHSMDWLQKVEYRQTRTDAPMVCMMSILELLMLQYCSVTVHRQTDAEPKCLIACSMVISCVDKNCLILTFMTGMLVATLLDVSGSFDLCTARSLDVHAGPPDRAL